MSTLTPTLPGTLTVPQGPPLGPAARRIVIDGAFEMPLITSLEEFIAWRESDDCPKQGRFAWIDGTLWVDLMTEQLYTHNQVTLAIAAILYPLTFDSGRFFPDGADLANRGVGLMTTPDGVYVSFASFEAGRVHEAPNRDRVGVIRLEGTPDMVLEIVSDSSEVKDAVTLPARYYAAGIPELWRVDARGELRFEILCRDDAGYQHATVPDGWCRSAVFGRDFRLSAGNDQRGRPRYTLEHRPPA